MRLFSTFLAILLFQSVSFSQTKITGTVIDEKNEPIEGINVIIKNSDNKTVEGTITDNLGHFSLSTTLDKIKIQILQFNEIYYEKEIVPTNDINLGLLKINNSNMLNEIVITAPKTKLRKELGKFIVDNISTSQFSKGKNTFEVLNYVPILNSTENGISILNKGEAKIFINGKPMGDNETALNMIKSIPASNIKKVEIIANPDSKFAANSRNGIINIILKNNENEGLMGSVGLSIYQSYFNSQGSNGFISYSKKKISITAGIKLDNDKGFNRYNYIYNNLVTNQQTQIASSTVNTAKTYSSFINSDYKFDNKNSLGVQFSHKLADRNSNTETNNIFKNTISEIISSTSLNNISQITPHNNSFRGNINYTHKLDNLGSNIYITNTQVVARDNLKNYFDYINSASPNEKFIQDQDDKFNINASQLDITKIIDENNKLLFGGNFIYSDIKNSFFYGKFDGIVYVSDPLQTNKFAYTDKTLSGYVSYERVINDKWEGKAGLRLESFSAKGKTDSNQDITKTKSTYLFPSFSLLFSPNENNEFSLDASSSIFRPYYTQLNPFMRWNSSNSYSINNPNLLASLGYELELAYSFKNRYFINISYMHDKNLFNDFDIVLPSNLIQTTTANYGNSNGIYVNLIYVNNFFNKNWNFTASINYNHQKTKGFYNDLDMSFSNNSYSFRLKNQINLSKNRDFNISCVYGYHQAIKTVLGNIKGSHSLKIDVNKIYKNFNFSISIYDVLKADLILSESKKEYSFYKKIDYFKTYSINIRYSFGNNKVRRVNEKNNEINKRLR